MAQQKEPRAVCPQHHLEAMLWQIESWLEAKQHLYWLSVLADKTCQPLCVKAVRLFMELTIQISGKRFSLFGLRPNDESWKSYEWMPCSSLLVLHALEELSCPVPDPWAVKPRLEMVSDLRVSPHAGWGWPQMPHAAQCTVWGFCMNIVGISPIIKNLILF